jgi:hypothetical protein
MGPEEIRTYLEIGAKRTFAGALDWPGWRRPTGPIAFAPRGYRRSVTTLQPGDPAPPFELLDQHGSAVRLEDYRGRKLLV